MEKSVKLVSLNEAIKEARRFIKAAEDARPDYDGGYGEYGGTKKTGAARRASLDLTRALSAYRQAGRM